MKSLIVYSSKTGNTKAVAHAIHEVIPQPCDIFPVKECPDTSDYDFIIIGYWVDKGQPDKKALDLMKTIKGKKTALFGTLGAYPDSEHGKDCMSKAEKYMEGNEFLGQFICQGKIDPEILKVMAKMRDNNHPMTEERKARIEEAKKHPNEEDFKNAREAFLKIVEKI
ncbi:MAG: flavodoxin [Deltaproteobacteria bacterium]|nr:MAG: flavodoxin [Deltaproteobacteria bacterium]PIE74909.1 MAG: flavodoxin [Deltaproteobacteria bacterium]